MINNVVLVGRVGNDPELKHTPSGLAIANFRLAVERAGKKDEQGNRETDWLNIIGFDKTAELVAQYCDKGSLIGVEGRIQSRSWEGQDGKRNYAVEIVANNVRFLESRAEAERRRAARGEAPPPGHQQRQAAQPPPAPEVDAPFDDDDDPFGDDE